MRLLLERGEGKAGKNLRESLGTRLLRPPSDDVATVKGFPVLPEAALSFSAQARIFVFPSVLKSQSKLNVSEHFGFLLLKVY